MLDPIVFLAGNLLVAPVWLAMIAAPRWRLTHRLAGSLVAPALVAVIYLVLVLTNMGATEGDFFTLEGVILLFQNRRVVLTGWMHYLALDLVVGAWIFRDAFSLQIRHRWIAPCLLGTLMYGPIGFLAYLVVRTVHTRSLDVMLPGVRAK